MIKITRPYKEDVLIPFCIRQNENELITEVYSEFVPVAKEFEYRFSDDPFCDEALLFISENVEIEGYYRTDGFNDYYILFARDRLLDIDTDGVVALSDAEYITDDTEFELDFVKEEGIPAFVIVENGEIASVCSINFEIEDDETDCEIAVETLEKYRRRGYAKKVICAMSNYLLSLGKRPTYLCSVKNTPSIELIKQLGFTEIQKEFYYNCYKRYNNAV